MRVNLDTDPAVIGIADRLQVPELHVIGLLWKVWAWADQHTEGCNHLGVTDVTLDRFTGVTGFANALRKVGWLTGKGNALTFPNFERHNGQTAKLRGKNQVKMAEYRNRKSVTPVTKKALPDKIREEKSTSTNVDVAFPANLGSGEFKAEWKNFRAHRIKVRSAMTQRAEELILATLSARPDQALAAVRLAMEFGWKGFKWEWFDNKQNNGTHQRNHTGSNRNTGTANEGQSSQYRGVGKVQ